MQIVQRLGFQHRQPPPVQPRAAQVGGPLTLHEGEVQRRILDAAGQRPDSVEFRAERHDAVQ